MVSAGVCNNSGERLRVRSGRSNLRSGDVNVRCQNINTLLTQTADNAPNTPPPPRFNGHFPGGPGLSGTSLLAGLPSGQMSRLQSVLRAAARLVLSLPGRVPVSAAMHDTLH